MNATLAAKLLPLLQAIIDGKQLEYRQLGGNWIELDSEDFAYSDFVKYVACDRWRIKEL